MERKIGWFDKPGNFKLFLRLFFLSLALLLIVDFFIPKHAAFPWEETPCFFAAYGYISCVLLVLVARVLRLFIKRNEDYYDR
jgi:hypothetical protein